MKVLTFLFVILFFSVSAFPQVAVMADMSGSPSSDRTKSWSTSKVNVRVGITKDLSATVLIRTSSYNREATNPNAPSDAGLVGLFYRLDPTIRFGGAVGLQTRYLQKKEIGWVASGDLFFGVVNQKNYYFRKQAFGYVHIEKGQWDKQFYVDARAMFPLIDFFALGGKFESDLGFGPHVEIKIPLADEERMKAIYLYGTYFTEKEIKTSVLGIRVAIN
ncbi:MAG: hypothetical protein WC842_02820 [Candidatus Paceibacterota bacterium]|jgi:hypothetical protein